MVDNEYDYRGQDELADNYTPTLDDPAIDRSDDGFQGEDSWQDFDESEDGASERYDRETPWTTDAALTFDTGVVQDLTVPDLQFSDAEQEAFSDPRQTLSDLADSVRESADEPTEATPDPDAPDDFNQTGPGVRISETATNGNAALPEWVYGVGGAGAIGIVGLLAVVLSDNGDGDN